MLRATNGTPLEKKVTLADFASIAGIVSSLAVLVSLVYLSLQLRQSARHQRASVHHDRLGQMESYLGAIFGDVELMSLQVRGQAADSTLTEIEANRFVFMQYANLLFYQEHFFLHLDGMIGEERYAHAVNNLRLLASEPGTRAAWRVLQAVFSPAFVTFMNKIIEETPAIANPAFFAKPFKDAARAELATARNLD